MWEYALERTLWVSGRDLRPTAQEGNVHTYIAESLVQQRVSALHAEAANRSLARSAQAGPRRGLMSVLGLRRQATTQAATPRVACQG